MRLNFTLKLSFSFMLMMSFGLMLQAQDMRVTVNSPAGVAGVYEARLAGFGTSLCTTTEFSGDLILTEDGTGGTTACDTIVNDLTGKIAVIDRGTCNFSFKCLEAQMKGAMAVIVCNNSPADIIAMGAGDFGQFVTIPSVMVSQADCAKFRVEIANGVNVTMAPVLLELPEVTDVIWSEDFSDGLDGWTTTGLNSEVAGFPVENAVWTYSADGSAPSVFASGSIETAGGCNGAALFDFQGYGTDFGNNTNVSSGNFISGELVSPTIDLSSAQAVQLTFTQYNIPLNGDNEVRYSTDDGATWSDPILVVTENELTANVTNIVGNEQVIIPLPALGGSATAKIKFVADNDFYFWLIDDIAISALKGTNAQLTDVFYTPLSYAVPMAHADADTFFFSGTVNNLGATELTNVLLNVKVKNDATEELVYEDNGTLASVAVGGSGDISASNFYVPNELMPGVYRMEYAISLPDQAEDNTNDNSFVYKFEITEDLFAKENEPQTGFSPSADGPWGAGALYPISANAGKYVASDAIFAVTANGTTMTDNYVDLFLFKMKDGTNFDNFDFTETDIFGHPSFDIVSQTTHVFTTEAPGDLVTLPLTESAEGVPLDAGATYMLFIQFDGTQSGSAAVANKDLFLGYNLEIPANSISDWLLSSQWFTGFQGDPSPVLRMRVKLSSDTDDTPLPEGAFLAYPNPANDQVIAEINFEQATDVTIIMANLDGRIVSMRDIDGVTSMKEAIDVSQFANGMYLMRVATKEGSTTHKIMVAH